MNEPDPSTDSRTSGVMLALFASLVCVVAFGYSSWITTASDGGAFTAALVEDVDAYEALAAEVRSGGIPYVDVEVEHLPVALGAMVVVGWVAELTGAAFWTLWIPAMIACFVGSLAFAERLQPQGTLGVRYLVVASPLLPLVLFRVEPLIGLFVAAGAVAWLAGRTTSGTVWTALGAFGKGWPITLLAVPLKRAHVLRSLIIGAVVGAGVLAVALLPGFRAAREFEGVHTETIVGSLLLGARHIAGSDLGLSHWAGAIYIDAHLWLVMLNSAIGVIVAAAAVVLLRRSGRGPSVVLLCVGMLTFSVMLMLPLFSAQFLFWPALFVAAADRGTRGWYIAAGVCGLAMVTVFEPNEAWWAAVDIAKNALVVLVVVRLARAIHRDGNQALASTSLRNLPV